MNNDFLNLINFRNGKIVYNDFDINPALPFADQKFSLKEDILQIEYGPLYLIDIGWYPELSINGRFLIKLVHNFNWENLVCEVEAKDLSSLQKQLQKTIDYCESLYMG